MDGDLKLNMGAVIQIKCGDPQSFLSRAPTACFLLFYRRDGKGVIRAHFDLDNIRAFHHTLADVFKTNKTGTHAFDSSR